MTTALLIISLVALFFVTTHELARRHRTRAFLCRERLRDIWRWRLSPLPRRRAMVRVSIQNWWTTAHAALEREPPANRPKVEFGSSLNHALAWAHTPTLRIRVSDPWLQKLGWGDVHETMGHEVAHLLTDLHTPEPKPHGPGWKRTMKSLGLPPTVRFEAEPESLPKAPNPKTDAKADPAKPSTPASRPASAPAPRSTRPHAAGRNRRGTKP